MDNKRNPDRDKMLEDILNNFDDKQNNRSTGTRRNTYSSRNHGGRTAPRKKINPAALNNDYARTTGFSVTPSHENIEKEDINVPEAVTAKLNVSEKTGLTDSIPDNALTNTAHQEQYPFIENNKLNRPDNHPVEYRQAPVPYNKPRKRRKKRSARLPIVLMVTTLIFTISICLSILIISVGRDMLAIGKGDVSKMVTIPEGANAKTVASILKEEEIIDIPRAFEMFSSLNGSDALFIPGQYELNSSDAYETIINILTTEETDDDRESVDVTFVEGISIYDAAKLLEENNVCPADRFIYYFNAGGYGFDFEERLPTSTVNKFYKMEGYLFPDTYTFYLDSDPESVCMKIYQNFENKITDEHFAQMQKKGMTLDEVVTLASIVQKEAPTSDSMEMVASVFENRLNNEDIFPKLQSDPTTYYVEEIIKPNIQIKSTAIFEAYDTYQGHGLPPGAICNPGIAAIEAVLYHDETDYFYFCADIDTMEIYYSETLEEHEEYLAMINGESDDDEDSEDEYYDEEYYYE